MMFPLFSLFLFVILTMKFTFQILDMIYTRLTYIKKIYFTYNQIILKDNLYDSIQAMNVYECNGTNILMRWRWNIPFNWEAELNSAFHLSPHENICTIARMRKHLLFVLYNLYKDSNLSTNLKEKVLKNNFSSSKTVSKRCVWLFVGKYYVDACVTLNTHTAPVACAPHGVLQGFLLASFLEQTPKDYIGKTEHSNVHVIAECNGK